MSRSLVVLLCVITMFASVAAAAPSPSPAQAANNSLEPLRVPAGSVLAFHLQTRLRHSASDPLDLVPQGTIVHVKILDAIDSTVDRDGSGFRGAVVSDLAVGSGVVVHSDAEVRGLLVLLRSRNHPDGFRYELILTELTDHGKTYPLTASLNASFYDSSAQSVPANTSAMRVDAKPHVKSANASNPAAVKVSTDVHQ